MKQRLDQALVARGIVSTRSQAESYIRLGRVMVNSQIVSKAGSLVKDTDVTVLNITERYVSRAGLKLASVAVALHLDFKGKIVLDVGSSTGGFTDYALQHGARKVIAVDVGTDQLHPTLHDHPAIELHEKTDIRIFRTSDPIDIVVADVSFISLRAILPSVAHLVSSKTHIVAMVKPQFETEASVKNNGVIKNDRMRRDILQAFELWARPRFIIVDKADSAVPGAKGNRERFYLLRLGGVRSAAVVR
jgi:23S rRNA (cytidine1920-2'-O)/16S rRNA (cytidine1409-2'-O)-methyltransferase